jgi:hypothetical protein
MRIRSAIALLVGVAQLVVVPAFAQMTSGYGMPVGGMPMGGITRQQFVQGYYSNVLERTPSADEMAAWQAILSANPGTADGRIMTHGFFDSAEHRFHATTPAMEVNAMYRALLGHNPSPGESDTWVQHMMDGHGVRNLFAEDRQRRGAAQVAHPLAVRP